MDKYSFLNTVHGSFFEDLYSKYLESPDEVEPSWRAFFQGFDFAQEYTYSGLEVGVQPNGSARQKEDKKFSEKVKKEFQVISLIDDYRKRGHLFTKTNPVRSRRTYAPNLSIENFNLSKSDLDTVFDAGNIIGIGVASLRDIVAQLEAIYCDSIGVEYMYIRSVEEVRWIEKELYTNRNQPNFSAETKKSVLKKLMEAVKFESFLHTKYVGQKRFSLEGGESLIPAIDTLIENATEYGVEQFVMGMSHRGRLNVLTNIFGKPASEIFSEFEGKDYEQLVFDGDVKYHLGWTADKRTKSGKSININISPNPSHLETVGAVAEGIARAKQENHFPEDFSKVLPIVVHGDAAISGQGIAYEVVQMATLRGYRTNGTIHIVVNNQIGFTTNYVDGRSSIYCTDVGKVTLSPVLHVNADDTEAVVHASIFALKFRMAFKRDVFIDLLGYRKYGHNEGDEPRFTQPQLYKAIDNHRNPMLIYAEKLKAEGVIDEKYIEEIEAEYRKSLEEDLQVSKSKQNAVITPFMENEWRDFKIVGAKGMLKKTDTSYDKQRLFRLAKKLTTLPKDIKFIRKVKRLIEDRRKMFFETDALDWAMGELLAYASLLDEGYNVRISGQDVERGTFSHRHAVLKSEDSEQVEILLDHISDKQGKFSIYNSLLSEYGVLGFDYGYAMASPNTLTIWEAQFGDFSNGAQIVIDQYISSGEDKWKTQNGIVILLPHGYEGQGAEHSSARVERYLQLCAKDNMYIANCTTPANFFHLLRRQMKTSYRKPLIVFTPKSLLRHPMAVSEVDEFAKGSFQMLIDDQIANVERVRTVVFSTGKFYYELYQERKNRARNDMALIRLEQLFPLPEKEMNQILQKYKNADDIVWAQEEPRNMGAWTHIAMNFENASKIRVASRRVYSSPASGSFTRDRRRQQEVITYVFDKSKNNVLTS
ncbi:2-oxoglutarate dehydrogenase E1 component [Elysia marginata]|uniref:2-oxoglutarate dehydrogenase, mitochondrial n=1 Tax=Elysia marginata TaxID=1093978 RepID=A0AAV4I3M0_9GAST|nr:2-oxoglutarate dehydrogenase E1 component [Elysia marginata]